jgi:hypothetical protein
MCATDTCCRGLSEKPCEFVLDTYSFILGVEDHATFCMDHNINNFITTFVVGYLHLLVTGMGYFLHPRRIVYWRHTQADSTCGVHALHDHERYVGIFKKLP